MATTGKCIIGGNATSANGITILDDGKLSTLVGYAIGTQWVASAAIDGAFNVAGMSGNNNNGIVVFDGVNVKYLSSVGNPRASWVALPGFDVEIAGVAGDRSNGITVFSKAKAVSNLGPKQESVVAQLVIGDDNVPDWKRKSAPPFDVALMAGDSVNGTLIAGFSDEVAGVTLLAKSGADCNCDWKKLPPLLFTVEMIAGDNLNGYVFVGQGQMVAMDAKGVVTKLPSLNFSIAAMTGNPKDGLAAILEGGVVAYCTDLVKSSWIVLKGPDAPLAESKGAASGSGGGVTTKGDGAAAAAAAKAPAPAAGTAQVKELEGAL